MKIDPHVHTSRYSACGQAEPNEMVETAKEQELDALVFTEHNKFWPQEEIEEINDRHSDIKVFNGAEIRVDPLHHILTYTPEPDNSLADINSAREFVGEVRDRGGFLVSAHPFRYLPDYAEKNKEFNLSGVEVASESMNESELVSQSLELAENRDSKKLVSSDAHTTDKIGSFYTSFDADPKTEEELIQVLKEVPTELHSPLSEVQ